MSKNLKGNSLTLFIGFWLLFSAFHVSAQERPPKYITANLDTLIVSYLNFKGETKVGKIICHKKATKDLNDLFKLALDKGYQFEEVSPVDKYKNDDNASMRANNTSCFNYRRAFGMKKLSKHAYGLAIDINPKYNPMYKHGKVHPENGVYDHKHPATLTAKHPLVVFMLKRGWKWGGNWKAVNRDYQHFQLD